MTNVFKIGLTIAFLLSALSVAAAQTDNGALDKSGVIKTVTFMKNSG